MSTTRYIEGAKMKFARLLMLMAGFAILSSGAMVGQEKGKKEEPKTTTKSDDKKIDDKAAPKKNRQLPANYGKLGLSDEQKEKVYKIIEKNSEEVEKLEAKIKELKEARVKDTYAVLTEDQKKRLKAELEKKTGSGK